MASFRRNLAWMAVAQGGLFLLQFVVSILVARLLSPYEMGIFAVALSIVGMLSIFRSLGLNAYLIRAPELTPQLLSTAFTINAVLGLAVAAAIAALSLLGGFILDEAGVRRLLLLMAILPLISILDFVPATGIERRGDFRAVALVNIARYSIANLATLALAWFGYGFMSLGYGQLIGALIALLMNNLFGRAYITLRPGLHEWRDVARFGSQMFTLSAIVGLHGRLADLLLAKLLGLAALGIFSRALSLTGVLWENLQIVLLRVFFVDLAEQRRQGRSLRHSYLRLTEVITGLLWPAFIGMAVVSGPVVITLLGERWSEAILPVSILATSSAIFVIIMIAHDIFVLAGATGLRTRIEAYRAPVSLGLFGLGCLVSLEAAAAMKVVEAVIMVATYQPHLERMTDTRRSDYGPILTRSALLTLAAVAPAVVTMSLYGWSPQTPLPVVLAAVGVGIVLWMVVLYVMEHPLFAEARRLVTSARAAYSAVRTPQA